MCFGRMPARRSSQTCPPPLWWVQLPVLLMDWTEILSSAGVPESPGRAEAVEDARLRTAARYERTGGPKRAKGSSSRNVPQVSRRQLQEKERRERKGSAVS